MAAYVCPTWGSSVKHVRSVLCVCIHAIVALDGVFSVRWQKTNNLMHARQNAILIDSFFVSLFDGGLKCWLRCRMKNSDRRAHQVRQTEMLVSTSTINTPISNISRDLLPHVHICFHVLFLVWYAFWTDFPDTEAQSLTKKRAQ